MNNPQAAALRIQVGYLRSEPMAELRARGVTAKLVWDAHEFHADAVITVFDTLADLLMVEHGAPG